MKRPMKRQVALTRSSCLDWVGDCVEGSFMFCEEDFQRIFPHVLDDDEYVTMVVEPSPRGRFELRRAEGCDPKGRPHIQLWIDDQMITGSLINFQRLLQAARKHWPGEQRFNVYVRRVDG